MEHYVPLHRSLLVIGLACHVNGASSLSVLQT
jgi:hypothetical protein